MTENKLLRATGTVTSLVAIILILYGNVKTPENFRFLDVVQTCLIFILAMFIFLPDDRLMKIALILGIFTMVIDFILETIAVYLDWWYPLGGTQFPPLIIVPLEMLIGFIFTGAAIGITYTYPEKIREMDFKLLNWLKPLFKNEKVDLIWRILLVLAMAIVGTHGDYTAGPEIWVPGPFWHPIYTFFVWFGGGLILLVIFYYLEKRKNT